MNELAIYDQDLARANERECVMQIKDLSRGESFTFISYGTAKFLYAGLKQTVASLQGLAGPLRIKYLDPIRYPNQGFSCVGCPYLQVELEYSSPRCAHPFYLEMFGCAQSVSSRKLEAPADCPKLGLKSETQQRRYRWHIKSKRIFWDYYHAAGLNPRHFGFRVYG